MSSSLWSAVASSWLLDLAQVYITPQRQRRGGEGCGSLIWLLNSDWCSYCNHQCSLYFPSAVWPCRFLLPSFPATPVSHALAVARFVFFLLFPLKFPHRSDWKVCALNLPVSTRMGLCENETCPSKKLNKLQFGAEQEINWWVSLHWVTLLIAIQNSLKPIW